MEDNTVTIVGEPMAAYPMTSYATMKTGSTG